MGVEMTLAQIKALTLIRDIEIESPKQFARLMWPDSVSWTKYSNSGGRGTGIRRAGGVFLSRLEKQGFVWRGPYCYRLTTVGKQALEAV